MPCDTRIRLASEMKQREQQIKKLEQQLKEKSAKIMRMGNVVSIEGWKDRGGWCDDCAIRRLRRSNDMTIRRLVQETVPVSNTIKFGHEH